MNKGFIALTSTLLLVAILTLLMVSTGNSSFFARLDTMGREWRRISLSLAEACVNVALLQIAKDQDYSPPSSGIAILVGENMCKIESVTATTIRTSAKYPADIGAYTEKIFIISLE